MKKAPIFYAWLMLALFYIPGCKPLESSTNSTHDKETRIERFDSTLTVAGDSATAALLLRCDSLGNVYLASLSMEQGKRIRLEVALKGAERQLDSLARALSAKGQAVQAQPRNTPMAIVFDCKEDSLNLVIQGLRERITQYESSEIKEKEPVKYIPGFYKFTMWFFWIVVVLVILRVAWYFVRKYYLHI